MAGKKGWFKPRNAVLIAVGIAILVLLLYNVDMASVKTAVQGADPMLLAVGFTLMLVSLLIKLVRWDILCHALTRGNSTRLFLIGLALNQVAPAGSGELARSMVARVQWDTPIGKTLAPSAIERIADTSILVGLTIVYLFFVMRLGMGLQVALPVLILVLGVAVLMRPKLLDIFINLIRKIGGGKENFIGRLACKLERALESFKESIQEYHSRKAVLGGTVFLTMIAWGVEGVAEYSILMAMNAPFDVSLWFIAYVTAVVATSTIVSTFSFLPGGLGAREFVFAFFLVPLGVPLAVGVAAALVVRAFAYVQCGAGGALAFMGMKKKEGDQTRS